MEQKKYIILYEEAIQVLGLTDAVVYCFIAGLGNGCTPSLQYIAQRCGMGTSSVKRSLARLRNVGAIEYNEGRGSSNAYNFISPDALFLLDNDQEESARKSKMNQLDNDKLVQNGPTFEEKKGQNEPTLEQQESPFWTNKKVQNDPTFEEKEKKEKNQKKNKEKEEEIKEENTWGYAPMRVREGEALNFQPDSADVLLEVFCDFYKKSFGVEYKPNWKNITTDKQDLAAALLSHKENFRDNRSEAEFFRAFFEGCLQIADDFERDHFSLSYINTKFNELFKKIINNGNNNGQSNPNSSDLSKYAPADILQKCARAFSN